MQLETFTNSSGELIQTLAAHTAFLPANLPPQIELGGLLEPLGTQIVDCIQLLSELRRAARQTENPYILIEPLQRREALTTSAMEGTHTTIEELALEAENLATPAAAENARETFNYVAALRLAVERLQTLPISHRVIKEAHKRLLSGLSNERGANKRPGEYKQSQNWIGGREPATARYVPPPPELTQRCMDDLERYINREERQTIQKVIDLALVHYQFEAIHPFADGNGRIGRMIITLMSMQSGLMDLPILFLSPYLEQHKDEYIDHMHNVSTKSEWREWLAFFVNCINETCKETIAKIDQLLTLQKDYKARAMRAGRSSKLLETADMLFSSPVVTVSKIEKKYGITYRAAQLILEKLTQQGILTAREGSYPKIYVATEILAAINR
jgi:Fic family protein